MLHGIRTMENILNRFLLQMVITQQLFPVVAKKKKKKKKNIICQFLFYSALPPIYYN